MPADLKHKPFAALRNAPAFERAIEPPAPPRRAPAAQPTQPGQPGRVVVRDEFDPQENAVICRVIGLPRDRLDGLGKQLRSALGVVAMVEGRDLLALSPDAERVGAWLRGAVVGEVSVIQRPPPVDLTQAGEAGGAVRAQIRRGLRVAIVQKADQPTGALTEGIVRDILTSSAEHHRGIKVRLESGEVGRVQRILSR